MWWSQYPVYLFTYHDVDSCRHCNIQVKSSTDCIHSTSVVPRIQGFNRIESKWWCIQRERLHSRIGGWYYSCLIWSNPHYIHRNWNIQHWSRLHSAGQSWGRSGQNGVWYVRNESHCCGNCVNLIRTMLKYSASVFNLYSWLPLGYTLYTCTHTCSYSGYMHRSWSLTPLLCNLNVIDGHSSTHAV